MKQYQQVLRNILASGRDKESGRPNMPHVLGISGDVILMDLQEGFPLLTTKKMPWKMIVHELLWFLRGETNIKYLVDNDVHIWDGDAYRWYQKISKEYNKRCPDWLREIVISTIDDFIEAVKEQRGCTIGGYKYGDLGKVYGHQWRNQNGVDQILDIIMGLTTNPYSRYHILDAWNKRDFPEMALPPCHLLYQFIVRPLTDEERIEWMRNNVSLKDKVKVLGTRQPDQDFFEPYNVPKFFLDMSMYQRSCDTFLGVPFNIASMSLLQMIMAKVANMEPGTSRWIGGDVHIYLDHIPVVKEQIDRQPRSLPKMKINKELKNLHDILTLTVDDFELIDYKPYGKLKGELFTGYSK